MFRIHISKVEDVVRFTEVTADGGNIMKIETLSRQFSSLLKRQSFKTAFLQNLLIRGAEATGFFHIFFSLKMPVEKVLKRDASSLCSAAKRLEARSKNDDKVAAKIAAMRTTRDNFTTLQS